ncbi:MAG TPA: hypothetical protein DDX86_02120 [Akkermansia sp.]|nr:hypothetical protein [Akkermansia sp.]
MIGVFFRKGKAELRRTPGLRRSWGHVHVRRIFTCGRTGPPESVRQWRAASPERAPRGLADLKMLLCFPLSTAERRCPSFVLPLEGHPVVKMGVG